jgi:hypothetical protein
MPLTVGSALEDLLEDLPAIVALVNKIQAGIAALPSPPVVATQFADDAKLVAACLPDVGALIDQVRVQIAASKASAAKPGA